MYTHIYVSWSYADEKQWPSQTRQKWRNKAADTEEGKIIFKATGINNSCDLLSAEFEMYIFVSELNIK